MSNSPLRTLALWVGLLTVMANPAYAYIGPGAGLGAIVVTVALALGVLLLLVGHGWFPLKRMLKSKKGADPAPDGSSKK